MLINYFMSHNNGPNVLVELAILHGPRITVTIFLLWIFWNLIILWVQFTTCLRSTYLNHYARAAQVIMKVLPICVWEIFFLLSEVPSFSYIRSILCLHSVQYLYSGRNSSSQIIRWKQVHWLLVIKLVDWLPWFFIYLQLVVTWSSNGQTDLLF